MTIACPRCHTAFVVPRRRAQTTATAIGGVAGAIQGVSSAMTEAKGGDPMTPHLRHGVTVATRSG